MTLKGDNGRTIQLIFGNVVYECNNNTYITELPTVVCNNRKVAEYIREETEVFLNQLSKKLL